MSKKELFKQIDSKTLKDDLDKYEDTLKLMSIKKKKNELVDLDKWLWNELKPVVEKRYSDNHQDGRHITKDELSKIMKWKLIRGKFRPLQKLVDSNDENTVKLCTKEALEILHNLNDKHNVSSLTWKDSLKKLTELKGIGVATASIVLAIFVPDLCPFMSDEVIESTCNTIDYTLNEYVSLQQQMMNKVRELNEENIVDTIWNTETLGKAIWVHCNKAN